jgi:hypothetical protein
VNLIDDVNAVLADLGRYPHFIHQGTDVLHRIVGGGIKFVDIVGPVLSKGNAGFTFIAWLSVRGKIEAIDGLGKNTCGCGLPYSPRTAEQIGMGQVITPDRIF